MLHRFTALASLALCLLACDRVAQGDRNTPELIGRILQSGRPVANASIVVARALPSGEARCRDAVASARTGSGGWFVARADRQWRSAPDRKESAEKFLLCVRPSDAAGYDTVFRALATRWDSLEVECDLARTWLRADRHGSTGQCVITKYGLEGQALSMRIPRPPPLRCDTTATMITPRGIGPVRLFDDVEELRRLCPGIRDTAFTETFSMTGYPEPRLVLDIAGQPVVFADEGGMIMNIVVSSAAFRTPYGVSVGMPMALLADKADLRALVSREADGPYALAWQGTRCGMAFASDRPGFNVVTGQGRQIPARSLREQAAALRVRRIYAGTCLEYYLPGIR